MKVKNICTKHELKLTHVSDPLLPEIPLPKSVLPLFFEFVA